VSGSAASHAISIEMVRRFVIRFQSYYTANMIRTLNFVCHLPQKTADALNAESGRIYSQVLVEQYRIYRRKSVWLSAGMQERYNDYLNRETPRLLQAHSIDAAQQGFQKACKTAKANRGSGARYPHKRKRYRTTVWKGSGIRLQGTTLLLSRARGLDPIQVSLPQSLRSLSIDDFAEARLVYNKSSRRYEWHLVIDDGAAPAEAPGTAVAAVDLGEVHPATLTDGEEACVISCRELRAVVQNTHRCLARFQAKQSRHKKGSRRWARLQRKKNRLLAKQQKRRRDLEHKASREVVAWAVEHQIGTLAIGDVRSVGAGKRLHSKSQQKVSGWSHGRMRDYIGYKAKAAGIQVNDKIDEAHTSQTCACCGSRHKPRGRVYTCPTCGSTAHRDVQGAANILSRFLYGELAKVPVPSPKYRHPALRGKRSSPGHGARCS
jgi:putative transposase